ncbi:cell division protein FtsL [Salirhabdus euzebyi]|uniref:Cell division protein FtsL n=1 Tax=Salirhabdus euzebyi TaxID=394506 RepID=A0A841Q9P5_9BACI|nr:cell division protein FtsL [Salirhabdus euzebyi]MBB6455023.1 cell division protein FtsL [Salirhabdus euzebyi]
MASVYAKKLEQYQPQEQRQTKVQVKVHKNPWISKGEKLVYSLFAMLTVTASIFIISYSSTLDLVNRDIQKMETDMEQQHLQNDTLRSEVKDLSKPSRILEIAKANGLDIKNTTVEQADIVR